MNYFNIFVSFSLRTEYCKSWECYDIVAEPANKGTAIMSPYLLSMLQNNQYRSGLSSLELVEERLAGVHMSVMFPYFSPLFEAFNEKIQLMLSNGLIDYWHKNFANRRGLKIKIDDIGPQILTMEHVSIGFLVCLFPMVLSILAFVGEIAVFKIRTKNLAFTKR